MIGSHIIADHEVPRQLNMFVLDQLHKRVLEVHQLMQLLLGDQSELSLTHLLDDSSGPTQVQLQGLQFGFGVFENHGVNDSRRRVHTGETLEVGLGLVVEQFVGVVDACEVGVAVLAGLDDVHGEVREQHFLEGAVVVPLRAGAVDAHAVVVREAEDVRVRGFGVHAVGRVDRARAEYFGGLDLFLSGLLSLVSENTYSEVLCFGV